MLNELAHNPKALLGNRLQCPEKVKTTSILRNNGRKGLIRFLPASVASIFAVWCIVLWLFGNEWKSLGVYYPLYPVSILIDKGSDLLEHWVINNPRTASHHDWVVVDLLDGLCYLVCGTIWYYLIGLGIRALWSRIRRPQMITQDGEGG